MPWSSKWAREIRWRGWGMMVWGLVWRMWMKILLIHNLVLIFETNVEAIWLYGLCFIFASLTYVFICFCMHRRIQGKWTMYVAIHALCKSFKFHFGLLSNFAALYKRANACSSWNSISPSLTLFWVTLELEFVVHTQSYKKQGYL